MAQVAVIGGGAFGTAMACVIRRSGNDTTLWVREPEVAAAVNDVGENTVFLPSVPLMPGIRATSDIADALKGAECCLLAVPAQFLRSVAEQMRPHIADGLPVVNCAKGIERDSCALMPEVIVEAIPQATVAALSGPSFAKEIAVDMPTGVSLACANPDVGERLAHVIGSPRFRTYLSTDVIGTALGGAMKNVFAIACGIAMGKRLGGGATATLITRGLAEMAHLGMAKGARMQTFLGLSGVGDLTLTCNALESRNTSFGVAIGEGRDWRRILRERKAVTEGFSTVAAAIKLGHKFGVDVAIAEALDEILEHDAAVDDAIGHLLAHPYEFEWESVASATG